MNDTFKAIQSVTHEHCAYRELPGRCPVNTGNPACIDCYRKINAILDIIADDIEDEDAETPAYPIEGYMRVCRAAHAEQNAIVEFIRGLQLDIKVYDADN